MGASTIIILSYIFIGIFVMNYDWQTNQKANYEIAKKVGEVEDGMAVMYMTTVVIIWPVFVGKWIFERFK